MAEKESIFTKINTRKLRERVFNSIVEFDQPILLQFGGKKNIKADVVSRTGKHIVIKFEKEFKLLKEEIVLCSFNVKTEKYFMKSTLIPGSRKTHKIDITADLYKLQRRENFRAQIPLSYKASVEFKSLNGNADTNIFPIFDLSAGGLSFEIPMTNLSKFKKYDEVVGVLNIPNKINSRFKAQVRYSRTEGSMGSGIQKVGLMFTSIGSQEEALIIELLMDIHKIFLAKLSAS